MDSQGLERYRDRKDRKEEKKEEAKSIMSIELTDREKKIILVKYIVHGTSPFDKVPLDERIKLLQSAAVAVGIEWNEREFFDIGQACVNFQQHINDSANSFLGKHKDTLIHSHKELEKGNDVLVNTVGEGIASKAKNLLRRGGRD